VAFCVKRRFSRPEKRVMITSGDFETRLDSRTFIIKAFDALERQRQLSNGISNLRLRQGPCKELIEEILPISAFLGCFERPGLNLFCEYFGSSNQNFDAKIYCEGLLVEHGSLHKEYFLEVSVAVHEKDYLKRESIEKGVPCFGGDKIERQSDGTIQSTPQTRTPVDLIDEHLNWIRSRIENKSKKDYQNNTFLIIPLFPDSFLMQSEWRIILEKLLPMDISCFCGLFIYDSLSHRKVFL
jgi:hypothetical protein